MQAAGVYDFSKTGFAQAAVGYYHPWEKFVVEGYLGAGTGYAYNGTEAKDDGEEYVEGSFNMCFGQVDLGWVSLLSGHFDVGLGLKGGFIFPNFTDYAQADAQTGMRTTQRYTNTHTFVEPQLMLRAGGEHLKVVLRIGLTSVQNKDGESQFVYSPIGVGLGMNYRF